MIGYGVISRNSGGGLMLPIGFGDRNQRPLTNMKSVGTKRLGERALGRRYAVDRGEDYVTPFPAAQPDEGSREGGYGVRALRLLAW